MKKYTIAIAVLQITGVLSIGLEPLIEASRNEFGGAGKYGCADTVAKAADLGVDYKKLVDTVLGENVEMQTKAFGLFGWLSANGGFDAASAQGHAAVTGILLRELGDVRFGELAGTQPQIIKDALAQDTAYDLGMLDNYNGERRKAKESYPSTIRVLQIAKFLLEYDRH